MFLKATLLLAALGPLSPPTAIGQEADRGSSLRLQSSLPWTMLPRAETSFGAEVHGGWLYVLGGYHGIPHDYRAAGQSRDFYRISLADPRIVEQLPSPGAVQSVSLNAHSTGLWRVGGMRIEDLDEYDSEMHSVATVARYDPVAGVWEPMPPLPQGRSSHEAVVAGDTLYVVGGWCLPAEDAWAEEMLALDLTRPEEGWRSIPQPFQRRALAVSGTSSHLLAIGGISSDRSLPPRVDVFDLETETWSLGPAFPGAPFAASAHAVGETVFATGRDGGVYSWAPWDEGWTEQLQDLAFPRFFGQLVGSEDGLYLLGGIGGMNRTGRIRAVERLTFDGESAAEDSRFRVPLPPGVRPTGVASVVAGSLHVEAEEGTTWKLRLTDLQWSKAAKPDASGDVRPAEAAAVSSAEKVRCNVSAESDWAEIVFVPRLAPGASGESAERSTE